MLELVLEIILKPEGETRQIFNNDLENLTPINLTTMCRGNFFVSHISVL